MQIQDIFCLRNFGLYQPLRPLDSSPVFCVAKYRGGGLTLFCYIVLTNEITVFAFLLCRVRDTVKGEGNTFLYIVFVLLSCSAFRYRGGRDNHGNDVTFGGVHVSLLPCLVVRPIYKKRESRRGSPSPALSPISWRLPTLPLAQYHRRGGA